MGSRTLAPAAVVRHFDRRFRALASPERAEGERAYMKSELRFHGVNAAQLRAECGAFLKEHPELERKALLAIADALFGTDWFDLRSAAIALLEKRRKLILPGDAPWLVSLARIAACWAHVDYLVTKVIGPVLEGDPSLPRRMRTWARDEDFWVRRVALLSQLGPLRRGGGDFDLFAEIATPMLEEREFFIRKAIGWVLREVSKKRPTLVLDFLLEGAPAHPNAALASGVTWREATKYLPSAMKRRVEAERLRVAR